MNKLALGIVVSLLIASQAMAQDASAPQPAASAPAADAPTNFAPVTAPTAPAYPSVQPLTMAPAGVTSTPAVPASTVLQTSPTPAAAPTPLPIDLNAAVGRLAAKPDSQQKLGQFLVIGSIMSCTQKSAGKTATEAFYQQMQAVGKTVSGYCKQGNAPAARTLVLSTLAEKHNDPVAKAVLTCYDQQKANVASLGGQQTAVDVEHYARWLRDPAIAKTEMQESDVCRNKSNQ